MVEVTNTHSQNGLPAISHVVSSACKIVSHYIAHFIVTDKGKVFLNKRFICCDIAHIQIDDFIRRKVLLVVVMTGFRGMQQ